MSYEHPQEYLELDSTYVEAMVNVNIVGLNAMTRHGLLYHLDVYLCLIGKFLFKVLLKEATGEINYDPSSFCTNPKIKLAISDGTLYVLNSTQIISKMQFY